MSISVLTGEDTITVFDRVLADFADGDVGMIAYNEDKSKTKTGKNKNTIYAKNEAGSNATVTLRLMRGSSDDRFLNGKMAASDRDYAATELANGEIVKRLGDGQGNILRDVYTVLGGIFMKNIDAAENVEGNTDQGVAIYTLFFADAKRSQQ